MCVNAIFVVSRDNYMLTGLTYPSFPAIEVFVLNLRLSATVAGRTERRA